MTVQIDTLTLAVPGQILRKYDADGDVTTLRLNVTQAKDLYDSLGLVKTFFDPQPQDEHLVGVLDVARYAGPPAK